jgi:hypothetical protein
MPEERRELLTALKAECETLGDATLFWRSSWIAATITRTGNVLNFVLL